MMARLRDVFECQITGEWGSECAENEIGIKVLRTTNFTPQGRINYDDIVVRSINESKVEKKRLHYGDIILEKSGGTEKTPVGRVVFCDESIEESIYLCNNFTQAMRVNQAIAIPRYVFYFMWNLHYSGKTDLLQNKTTGIRNLQVKSYLNENCPLPSLGEQCKIAAVLDKVSDLIAKRRRQLAKLDELVKSRFIEMFGEGNYSNVALIDIIAEGAGLSYGIVQPGDDGTGDMGVLRPVDLVNGKISTASIKYIERSIGDGFRKTELTGDELLITVRGTTGVTALTDTRFRGMNVTRGIAVIRYDRNKTNPVYLNVYLNTEESQRYIQEHTRGATLQQINLSDLRIQPIMVPPIELQERFADFVEQTDKSKAAIQKSLETLETLKKALMQQYFG
ncbi:restriction endonuclease subunit S [Clostridiaceae bacterium NSJ-31]|uniref:Restriction endonuclease subunit S n=2 Tax=Ligaoa zhengdingensis TaxID=2763658 RepID=A0A926E1X3_9FIRM|nr:restriction endonuclease subunit S [Ligaoa zhengdingensis]